MAQALGIILQQYIRYEKDRGLPVDLAVKLMQVTRVNPRWLYHGKGEAYLPDGSAVPAMEDAGSLIGELLEEIERLRSSRSGEEQAGYGPNGKLRVPILAIANAAGTGCRIARDADSVEAGNVTIPADAHLVEVHDESMKPLALPGQYVWVSNAEPASGDLALVEMREGNEIFFKRVYYEGDIIQCVSVNQDPRYAPRMVERKVVRRMRKVLGTWYG